LFLLNTFTDKEFHMKIMLNRNAFLAVFAILTGLLCCAQPALADKTETGKAGKKKWGGRATPVVVTQAVEQFLSPTIQVPGTVLSRQQSDLPSEVSGKLTWVADVGTHLTWGEAVATLDDTLPRLRANENKATLSRERARLSYLNKEYKRLEELIRGDFSSKNELDKIALDRAIAQAEVSVAEARVKFDEETLARYIIRVPFDGIVVKRTKKPGEWVSEGATLVTFSNPDKLEVQARVSEKTISHLKPGYRVRVLADNRASQGTVRAIVRIGDAQSHLFEIRIDLSVGNWVAGKTVRVDVPIGKPRKVLSVTRDALVLRRDGVSLYRVNAENKSEKINVTTGITGGDYIEILGDIKPGDNIVVRGNERLRAGQSVKVIPGNTANHNAVKDARHKGKTDTLEKSS